MSEAAEAAIRGAGGVPSMLGYRGFPSAASVSVNEEACHAPASARVLRGGDVAIVDVAARIDGFHGDCAATVIVGGGGSREAINLLEVAQGATRAGVASCRAGVRTGYVGRAVDGYVKYHGLSIVRSYGGHGIGRKLHMEPTYPFYGRPNTGALLEPGMAVTVEPIVTVGSSSLLEDSSDGWTARTADGSLAAMFEETVYISDVGAIAFTAL